MKCLQQLGTRLGDHVGLGRRMKSGLQGQVDSVGWREYVPPPHPVRPSPPVSQMRRQALGQREDSWNLASCCCLPPPLRAWKALALFALSPG